MTTKICTKCNCEKELNQFSFRKDINNYRGQCKACTNLHRLENKEFFNEKSRKYRLENKDKKAESDRKYRLANRESLLAKKREYHHKNRDNILIKKREYYLNNKEHYSEASKEYRNTEKGKILRLNSNNKRRSQKKQGDVTKEQILNLYKNTSNCYWCGVELVKNDIHLDHFYPLSLGGKHTISNLVLACSKCNLRKKDKDPYIFAKEIGKVI